MSWSWLRDLIGKCALLLFFAVNCLAVAFPAHAQAWISKVDGSVVRVIAQDGYGRISYASGWVLAKGGYVVTNQHAIGQRRFVVYRDAQGKTQEAEAEVVGQSKVRDLAILRIEADLTPLTISSAIPNKGSDVFAMGFPAMADRVKYDEDSVMESTVTSGKIGRVVEFSREEDGVAKATRIQHSAEISPGNSGGPLFDACGRVIGINTAQFQEQGLNYAMPVKDVLLLLGPTGEQVIQDQKNICQGQTAGSAGAGVSSFAAWLADYWPILGIIIVIFGVLIAVIVFSRSGAPAVAAQPGQNIPPSPTHRVEQRQVWVLRGVTKAGRPVVLEAPAGSRKTVGRAGGSCDLQIDDPTVSRKHASFDFGTNNITVMDLGSSNGTYADGRRLGSNVAVVSAGQSLRVGSVELVINKRSSRNIG